MLTVNKLKALAIFGAPLGVLNKRRQYTIPMVQLRFLKS